MGNALGDSCESSETAEEGSKIAPRKIPPSGSVRWGFGKRIWGLLWKLRDGRRGLQDGTLETPTLRILRVSESPETAERGSNMALGKTPP